MNTNLTALLSLHAELSLLAVLLVLLVADLFRRPGTDGRRFGMLAAVLMVLQTAFTLTGETHATFGGMYIETPFTSAVKAVLSAGTLLVMLSSNQWLGRSDTRRRAGEFYVLLLSTLLGMYLMVSAGHFLLFYVGLETASIPMACLAAFDKHRRTSAEAGAKYILTSMFSSALLLYGLSLLYAAGGTLYFADLPALLAPSPLAQLALVLFIAGMGFKMSLVPFHLWTADVYQGAPTAVTAYLSVISKGAAAVSLAVIMRYVFPALGHDWRMALAILTVASITVGNLMAILQSSMKRFMAFSSISQAGYIVLAVLPADAAGMASTAYYVAVYIVANLAAFAVIGAVEEQSGISSREGYSGLYATNPRLSLALTLALFSLGGIPPFAGFFSKFFVFAAAASDGWWLVVFLALVNTIVSLYYYLLVVKAMYISQPSDGTCAVASFRSPLSLRLSLVACVAGICLLGICSFAYEWLHDLASALPAAP